MGGDGGGGLILRKGFFKSFQTGIHKRWALTGGRQASIMRVVMQNLAALRYEYNKRLREKPGLKGKITVKFAIDEFGTVIFAQVVESTISDSQLEHRLFQIKRWKFEKLISLVMQPIIYPFVFSQ